MPVALVYLVPVPRISALFPYTTLFRSRLERVDRRQPVEDRFPAVAPIATRDDLAALRADVDPGRIVRVGGHRHPHHVRVRSEEHTSELQSLRHLVCRLLLEKKKSTRTR